MAKTKHINFRVTENEFRKIQVLRNGKTIGDFFRDIIRKTIDDEKKEANDFLMLMEKINDTSVSNIIGKINLIIDSLDEIKNSKPHDAMLKDILFHARKADIGVEEFAAMRLVNSSQRDEFFKKVKEKTKN